MSDHSFTFTGAPESASEAVKAAPATEGTAPAATEENKAQEGQEGGPEEEKESRTFTQEEVNRIAQQEREKGERRAKRELEARMQEAQRPANQPEPTREQYPAGTEGDQAYFKAAVDHAADVKLMQQQTQQTQMQAINTHKQREEGVIAKYDDYQAVVYKDPDQGGPAVSEAMGAVIIKSEMGPEMAYYLGKNVQESHRIFGLDPIDQVREMVNLEAKLKTNPPAVKTSSAPEPIKPTRGSAAPVHKYGPDDPRSDKMTDDEWFSARLKQMSGNR